GEPARGGTRPRRQRGSGVLARHAPDVPARDPHWHRDRLAADVRRLLHERPAGHTEDEHVRKPHLYPGRAARRQDEDGVARAHPFRDRACPDDVLPPRDAARGGAWLVSATLGTGVTKTPTGGYFKNPWRKPRILQGATIGYLLWSLLPVVIAVIFSFNGGRSRNSWQSAAFRGGT